MIVKVSGYIWTPTNLSLLSTHPEMTMRDEMISMRAKTKKNMTRRNCSAGNVAEINQILTYHANASWTCFLENSFLKVMRLFFLIEDPIGASFFGLRRRLWAIPIGWATEDNHSSALKTAYGEADGVIYVLAVHMY